MAASYKKKKKASRIKLKTFYFVVLNFLGPKKKKKNRWWWLWANILILWKVLPFSECAMDTLSMGPELSWIWRSEWLWKSVTLYWCSEFASGQRSLCHHRPKTSFLPKSFCLNQYLGLRPSLLQQTLSLISKSPFSPLTKNLTCQH